MLLLFAMMVFSSCENQKLEADWVDKETEVSASVVDSNYPSHTYQTKIGSIVLPDGSLVMLSADSSSVKFQFPEGVYWVGLDQQGDLELLAERTYECSCPEGGCTVVYNEFFGWGCHDGPCRGIYTGKFLPSEGTDRALYPEGGFIDFGQGISLVESKTEEPKLFVFSELLLRIPQVQKAWNDFQVELIGHMIDNSPTFDQDHEYVAVNFFGVLAAIALPSETADSLRQTGFSLRDVSCWCNQPGTGDCELEQKGSTIFCGGGGCVQCRMRIDEDEESTH